MAVNTPNKKKKKKNNNDANVVKIKENNLGWSVTVALML